jgi:hypothetical protein
MTNPNCKHINAAQNTFIQNGAHKILVKLTPGRKQAYIFAGKVGKKKDVSVKLGPAEFCIRCSRRHFGTISPD